MISAALSSLNQERRRHPSRAQPRNAHFAHESERVVAQLLDLYEVTWIYEPFEFAIAWNENGVPTKAFRPDFWLPERQCFIELTTAQQRLVTRKNAKVRAFRALYPELSVSVVYQRDYRELVRRHGLAA